MIKTTRQSSCWISRYIAQLQTHEAHQPLSIKQSHANYLLRNVNGWLSYLLWLKKPQVNSIQHSWDKEKDIYHPRIHFGLLIYQLCLQNPSFTISGKWQGSPETYWTCKSSCSSNTLPQGASLSSLTAGVEWDNLTSKLRCLHHRLLKTMTMKN